jgi:hypothetical protein
MRARVGRPIPLSMHNLSMTLPLHKAAEHCYVLGDDLDVLKILIREYPSALLRQTQEGKTPVDLVGAGDMAKEFLTEATAAFQLGELDVVKRLCRPFRLPSCLIIDRQKNWDEDATYIASLTDIELFDEVKSFDADTLARLALAMPVALLTELLAKVARVAMKNPLTKANKTLNLPLHIAAVGSESKLENVKVLVRQYPRGLLKVNADGMTPMECAEEHWLAALSRKSVVEGLIKDLLGKCSVAFAKGELDVVERLCQYAEVPIKPPALTIKKSPSPAFEPARLSRACSSGDWETVRSYLAALTDAEVYEATIFADRAHQTLLHNSLQDMPLDELSTILDRCMIGVKKEKKMNPLGAEDIAGYTPLHLAAVHTTNKELIVMLVRYFPQALEYKNITGVRPVDEAMSKSSSSEIKELLDDLTERYEAVGVKIIEELRLKAEVLASKVGVVPLKKKPLALDDSASKENAPSSPAKMAGSATANRLKEKLRLNNVAAKDTTSPFAMARAAKEAKAVADAAIPPTTDKEIENVLDELDCIAFLQGKPSRMGGNEEVPVVAKKKKKKKGKKKSDKRGGGM